MAQLIAALQPSNWYIVISMSGFYNPTHKLERV